MCSESSLWCHARAKTTQSRDRKPPLAVSGSAACGPNDQVTKYEAPSGPVSWSSRKPASRDDRTPGSLLRQNEVVLAGTVKRETTIVVDLSRDCEEVFRQLCVFWGRVLTENHEFCGSLCKDELHKLEGQSAESVCAGPTTSWSPRLEGRVVTRRVRSYPRVDLAIRGLC